MPINDLFTFIVPALNGEATLQSCLDSIFQQSYKKIEVIVVDNGSTDRTKEIALSYKEVRYFFVERKNRSLARNAGASHAQGKYLCFIDCDVILSPSWLESALFYLERRPVDFLATQIVPRKKDGALVDEYRYFFADWKSHSTFLSLQKRSCLFPVVNTAASIVLKDSFDLIGRFNEALERNEDLEISMRFFLQGYLLGGVSTAKASVGFCEELSFWRRNILYLKRAFVVQFYSLFGQKGSYTVNRELLKAIWFSHHQRRLLLAFYSLLFEVSSMMGVWCSYVYSPQKFQLQDYQLKRGKKTIMGSFFYEGKLNVLKHGVNFLFIDEGVFCSKDFCLNDFERLSNESTLALQKLFNKDSLTQEETEILNQSDLFEQYAFN